MSEINFDVNDNSEFFDDDIESASSSSQNSTNGHKSAEFSFTRVKLKPLTDEKREELKKKLCTVIIQDYNDDYNLSEEERKEKNKYYDVFSKYIKRKKKPKKIPEFIDTMRLALDCVEVVSLNNGLYDPKEFTKKVLSGKIKICGLTFPKYIGKDKKYVNWDYVWELILDKDRNADEFKEMDNFSEEDYQIEYDESKIQGRVIEYNDSYDVNDEDIIDELSDKETKAMFKLNPEIWSTVINDIKMRRKRANFRQHSNSMVYSLTNDDFSYIANKDNKRNIKSKHAIPEFTGDIMNKKDCEKYLKELQDYEDLRIKVNYDGKMRSQDEIDDIKTKNALEEAGWNLRALYNNKDKKRKMEKAYRKEKKKEKLLKKELLKSKKRKEKLKSKQN